LVVSLLCAAATPAWAGTAQVRYERLDGPVGATAVLVYTGAVGEVNNVTVTVDGRSFTVFDASGVRPGTDCVPIDALHVRCQATAPDFAAGRIEVRLGDRNDGATVVGAFATLAGGDGDDVLRGASDHGARFVGGDGDDQMFGGESGDTFDEGTRPNGSDLMSGGASRHPLTDRVSYARRRGDVFADLAGDRNDGEAGERDLIGADVEDLEGGRGDDRLHGDERDNLLQGGRGLDVLVGGPGHDVLWAGIGDERTRDRLNGGPGEDDLQGGAGDNVLTGGPGADRIAARAGDDRIRARDDAIDEIHCEQGRDRVRNDGTDFLADRCERTDPDRLRAAVPLEVHFEFLAFFRPSAAGLLGCPRRGPRRCAGEVRLEYAGRTLGAATFRILRGRVGVFHIGLPSEVVDALRPQGSARVEVIVTSEDARGRARSYRCAFDLRIPPVPP
jgi:Ca2+-binding RTX toxin-like protein